MWNRWLDLWSKISLKAEIVYAVIENRRGVTAVEYALIAASTGAEDRAQICHNHAIV